MHNKLTLRQTIYYGLPGFPLAMLGLPLFIYLPSFYSQELGLSLTSVGIALLLARFLDVITDPLIGFLNSHYPRSMSITKRRKSFILLGLPILIVGLNFLLKPSENVNSFYLFFWSFVAYLGWTLINIPWFSMGAEINRGYHEKTSLASSREIFAVLGTVIVMSIPVVLSMGDDLKQILIVLANMLTVVIPLSLIPLLLKISLTHNNQEIKNEHSSIFRKENLSFLKDPLTKKLLPAYFINCVANALPATLFILYVKYIIQEPNRTGVLLLSYFASAIVGIVFWLYLAKKLSKQACWKISVLCSIISFCWVPIIGLGDFIPFLIICVASGFCLGADMVMPSSIQADIAQKIAINEDNKNETAIIFGFWGMLTKLSLALSIGIAFPVLDFMGLDTSISPVADVTSNFNPMVLIGLYAGLPIILKLWVFFHLNRISIDISNLETYEKHDLNKRQLL